MSDRTHRRPTRSAARGEFPDLPTSRATATANGWSDAARRYAVAQGDLDRLRRGVYARPAPLAADDPLWRERERAHVRAARAAAVSSPRSAISHLSAALLLGQPALRVPDRPCLTVPAGTALRRVVRAHLHRATLGPDDVVTVGTDVVTSPARTVMDVAREFGVDAGVVLADAALHSGSVDDHALAAAYELCAGWPGRTRARITMRMLDGRAESPLESLSRLRIAASGLPAPWPQTIITDAAGRFLGRCDFYSDAVGVVGECDGAAKYEDDDEAVTKEHARQELFEEAGLIVVRWGWPSLVVFERTAERLRAAAGRGARPGSPLRRWTAVPTTLHSTGLLIPDSRAS